VLLSCTAHSNKFISLKYWNNASGKTKQACGNLFNLISKKDVDNQVYP